MEKFTQFSEKFGKLPRFVKVAGALGTFAALAKINYELNPKPEVTVLNLHGTIVAGRAGLNGQPPINMENLRKKMTLLSNQSAFSMSFLILTLLEALLSNAI